jgi:hypothetical protein
VKFSTSTKKRLNILNSFISDEERPGIIPWPFFFCFLIYALKYHCGLNFITTKESLGAGRSGGNGVQSISLGSLLIDICL